MISKGLKSLLEGLDLLSNDAVFFRNEEDGIPFPFPSKETEKKLDIIRPTAYYVFNSQPYVLFFDLSENVDINRENEIHKQAWSFDQSPVIFIIKHDSIEIFNAFSYEKKLNRLQEIKLKEGENVNTLFSFWNLQSGGTWTWLQKNYYVDKIQEKRVNQKLFENIQLVRESLTNKGIGNSIGEEDANILILRLIFIRYLIDRNVKLDEEYITGTSILDKRKSFSNLIEKPKKLSLFFEWLNDKFNGVLFKDTKIQLSKSQSEALALIFNGEKPEKGSLFEGGDFYFEIFDFSIIPVEVISGIYEALIDEETRVLHSAVYTPSFLVEYILTNTVDKHFLLKEHKKSTECSIFDPSVGSGIFLVQAYRRMVDREIELSTEKKISKVRLREIAQNNLFGIDINGQALKVTCFSIYIAMLDYIDPKSILPKFHFPDLIEKNLFEVDFFDTQHTYNEIIRSKQIDFILGNPPWKENKSVAHLNWINSSNIYSKNVTGAIEIAQSFLLRTKELMQPQTVVSLIVTSTIFYNVSTTTREFKNLFLKQYCISNFFDLSAVRQSLFEQQTSPASIVFYQLADGDNYLTNIIQHQSLKANLFLKYYKTLVVEKYDQKRILQRHFIENDWMFKVALYGNTLDFQLVRRIEEIEYQVKDIIDDKIVFKGAGIERGKGSKPYPNLIGLAIVENSDIVEYYTNIDTNKTLKEADVNLRRGKKIEIFKGFKILLKEQAWNKPIISYVKSDCVFRKGAFTITSKDDNVIKLLYSYLITDLYSYFLFNISCAWGVGTRPAIRFDEEYLAFPLTQPSDETKEKLISLVSDFLKPFEEHYSSFHLGEPQKIERISKQINTIVEKQYKIKDHEKDLIDYTNQVSRYQFQEGKLSRIVRNVHNDHDVLEDYADVFLKEFSKIYQDEFLQVLVYPLNHFIAMNFVFCNLKPQKKISIINSISDEQQVFGLLADHLPISEISKNLFIQKDIKGFEENSFYIIKPNEYKSWHRAMAWYDVAEIKEAIQSSELERLNQI